MQYLNNAKNIRIFGYHGNRITSILIVYLPSLYKYNPPIIFPKMHINNICENEIFVLVRLMMLLIIICWHASSTGSAPAPVVNNQKVITVATFKWLFGDQFSEEGE